MRSTSFHPSGSALGAALVVATALLLGCGPGGEDVPQTGRDGGTVDASQDGGGGGDSSLPHELSTIEISPLNPIMEVDLGAPSSLTFVATGRYLDGTSADISGDVTWTSENSELGTFSGATLEIPALSTAGAQVTRIEATHGDIVGVAQLTVVAYRMTGDQTDFFFILPYQDPSGNQSKPLDFRTDIRSLDVFFAMDTTGSMFGEISNLQSSLNAIATDIQTQIPDTQLGAGAVEDFPDSPNFIYGAEHGSDCGRGGVAAADQPLKLFQTITDDVTAVQTAVNGFSNGPDAPIGCGNDWPEAMMEALYQVATGEGLTGPPLTNVPANHDGLGGVGFRQGTMPVVVPVTDALFHAPGESTVCSLTGESVDYAGAVAQVAHNRTQTEEALATICARVVGVASIETGISNCSGQADEEAFATATGARVPPAAWDLDRPAGCAAGQCCTNLNGTGRPPDANGLCPLVFRINADGSGLGSSIITGLQMLTRYAAFDVTTATDGATAGEGGEALPDGVTTADFIKSIIPASFEKPPEPPVLPDPVPTAEGFAGVTPGTVVSFLVYAYNDIVEPTDQAQIFRAVIRVLAGGCTDLDEREVFILVPPKPIGIG